MTRRSLGIVMLVPALAIVLGCSALAQSGAQTAGTHWVATWTASPQPLPAPVAGAPPQPAPAPQVTPIQAPPPPPIADFNNQTVRMIARTSIGGRRIRIQLSNAHGAERLVVGSAHVALRAKNSAIVAGSDRVLAFSGKPSVTIPVGALVVSDPVDLAVPALTDLAISVYVPGQTGPPTFHARGLHTTYVSKAGVSKSGDFTGQAELTDTTTSQSWYWLSSVEVLAPADTPALVAFGDSITDGSTSTPDTDRSWPSALARRLAKNPATANIAILNQGIAGNRVLRDNVGINALARFDRDVLSQVGVKWVILLEGINDIRRGSGPGALPADATDADDLIAGYRQLIERAHSHGIKIFGATLTPNEGDVLYSEKGEAIRQTVNQWIRTSNAFDAVIDFEAMTRDASHPKQLRSGFNIQDHLHPNDAGYQAMADGIDLSLFSVGSKK